MKVERVVDFKKAEQACSKKMLDQALRYDGKVSLSRHSVRSRNMFWSGNQPRTFAFQLFWRHLPLTSRKEMTNAEALKENTILKKEGKCWKAIS